MKKIVLVGRQDWRIYIHNRFDMHRADNWARHETSCMFVIPAVIYSWNSQL